MRIECLCGRHPHRLHLWTPNKPRHACAVKSQVLKSWTLEIDYSRTSRAVLRAELRVLVLNKRHVGSGNEIANSNSTYIYTCAQHIYHPGLSPLQWQCSSDRKGQLFRLFRSHEISLQNRRISGASAIHERAREARGQKNLASRARSCIALSPLIRLFCRLHEIALEYPWPDQLNLRCR